MTIVLSNWGSDYNGMSWLDGDSGCGGDCRNNPTSHFNNFVVETGSTPVPPHGGKFSCSDGGC